jgi:hypothetical protein
MRHTQRSTMFGSVLLSAAVLGLMGPAASAGSSAEGAAMSAVTQPAAGLPADNGSSSPYQQGYKDGYAAGVARAWNTCNYDWPQEPKDYNESAYSRGYYDAYGPGYEHGAEEHCKAPKAA